MKISREKTISTFYVANKNFWTMKTSVSKSHKIRIFPKGLVHGFGEKFNILLPFRFIQNIPEKVFADVLVRKQAFLDNTTTDFKKREIGIFPKGIVHEFGQKVEAFSSFEFIKNRSRKSVC